LTSGAALLLGPPLATARLVHERLRKVVALAVFSSDAISSTAYGTEQIMLVLVAGGAMATGLAFPIALAIGALLAILILSYRQTITAYPSAGGAYVVSRDNFGPRWAAVAGSALLIDYVLTVAVSVTSGVAALTTALPQLQRLVLPLSLAAIVLIMWADLRGVRESGRAVLHALQYARQLNPLSVTALHVAGDPDAASRLARLWATLPLAVPLQLVHCPDRNLVACAAEAVGEHARPDTEVTVLLPPHGNHGGLRQLLHDQTGRDLFVALNRLAGVNVAIVHPPAAAALRPAAPPSAHPAGP